SGAALLHSNVWTAMMADTLGHSLTMCLEPEATSRGAALLALERLGIIASAADPQTKFSGTIQPDPTKKQIYLDALAKQRDLYQRVFENH
ncbi:MAG: carbohydrate kinase, partial [Terriglobia bacterium]